jgi:hypothetical protein
VEVTAAVPATLVELVAQEMLKQVMQVILLELTQGVLAVMEK